jgi:ribonuclease T2
LAQIRNFPYEGWQPAFVVWPVNEQQVQASVRFAVAHNLCIMVAGTGHDFLNRHSCKDGVFIRTSLMKKIEWDLNDTRKFGNPDGNVKLGAGLVWSEVHKAAAKVDRYVSSGWAATVGVIGWSIGGGHGPFGPSHGLGVDKILEVDIVLNDGSLVSANASNSYSDLFWAIRGGGGSTWGVITSITIKAHKLPKGGFTRFGGTWTGNFCNDSLAKFDSFIDTYQNWTLKLGKSFAGLTFIVPQFSTKTSDCYGTWDIHVTY